jgi:cytochrome c551/c552
MRHAMPHRITLAAMLLAALTWPLAGQASSQLASDKGCYNCHGTALRGDAPSFERLASKLTRYQGDLDGEQKFVTQFLTGDMFQHIDAHEQLTPEAAKALLHWLVEGGK